MTEKRSRFVLLCQRALAAGVVIAVAAPAASVITLDIVAPAPETAVGGSQEQPGTASLVATEPIAPDVIEVPVPGVDRSGPGFAARSAPEAVVGYATVGLTWAQGEVVEDEEISASVRSLESGVWSQWEQLEYHDEHGPDPEGSEGRDNPDTRPGTDPIVVGNVDQVQVRVTASGEVPNDLSMAVIDPGQTTTPEVEQPAIDTASSDERETGAALASADTVLSAARAAKPKIYSRAQWGADERMRDKGSLRYGTVKAGFVHHTVNANSYTSGQVPSLIRGIYAYHTQSQRWSDIGYNFVVDRFGRIWEGRYGGVTRAVVGAHTLGYNDYSFAMSAIGNFDTVRPPAVMLDAYARLFAWKLSLHGVKAGSTSQRLGSRTFKAINGHRDAGSTACPGRYLYAKLPKIRTRAVGYQKGGTDPDPPPDPEPPIDPKRSADISGSPWPDLVVRDGSSKRVSVVQTGGQVAFESAEPAGQRWDGMDLLAGSRDLTGDQVADMVARDAGTKRSGIYPGDGRGGFGDAVSTIRKFRGSDQLTGVGDFNGDGENDMVARDSSSKALYLYPGNGEGGFSRRSLLAPTWKYNRTFGVGDLDGDDINDLAARDRSGALKLFSGTSGTLGAPTTVPNQWDGFDILAGLGDLTNDGEGDIIARDASSKLTYIYPGSGDGLVGDRLGPFSAFSELNFLTSPGQVAGTNRSDLVGRTASGRLVSFTNTGRKNIAGVVETGWILGTADLLVNSGDWDGDGHGDLITRSEESGRMYLRRGDGNGHFAEAVLAGTGWGSIGSISPVGDVTGDGNPDLVGRPEGGSMRTFPGDGESGFLRSRPVDASVTNRLSAGRPRKYDWMLNVGDANGDNKPDLIARAKVSGKLWLMPGSRKGYAKRRFIGEGFASYDLGG